MATVVKISVKNFNSDKLREELEASGAGAILISIGWPGFDQVGRIRLPIAARRETGRSVVNGSTVLDFADPGEIRFHTTRDLTGPEDTALMNALTAHNALLLSAEQVRQDQDEADLDAIIATERAAFVASLASLQTALNAWDAASTANKLISAKNMFTLVRADLVTIAKILRLVLRKERSAAI